MKRIKVIAISALGFITIASTVFVACQKENTNIFTCIKTKKTRSLETPNVNIRSILNSGIFTNYCTNNSFSFNTNNYIFYQEQNINLYHYKVNEKTSIAILENTLDNTYIILRKESNQLENGKPYQIYSFLDNKLYTPFPIVEEPSNKPNAPKTYPENYNPNLPCNSQGYSFGECAECGWADLNNSMSGALACTFNPQICWVAVGIHCALGSPLYQPGGTTYPLSYQLNNNVTLIN